MREEQGEMKVSVKLQANASGRLFSAETVHLASKTADVCKEPF